MKEMVKEQALDVYQNDCLRRLEQEFNVHDHDSSCRQSPFCALGLTLFPGKSWDGLKEDKMYDRLYLAGLEGQNFSGLV